MSCLPGMGQVPDGYGLLQKLPMSLPPVTSKKIARLIRMATSDRVVYRAAAASNPRTPALILEALARDPKLVVRSWVARNPACPQHILETLADSDDDLAAYARWKMEAHNG